MVNDLPGHQKGIGFAWRLRCHIFLQLNPDMKREVP
ncbi:hypothetical protein DET57_11340 [Klebsiella oxytoca]|uniref:Uncharacterized protein n=1 Tax=Klebsiella oxytoca TaxID=571 RepID=A0A318FH37_KLEOX|nr:hypothetical protein DET57_11340 [Klebsiella oxytoca]